MEQFTKVVYPTFILDLKYIYSYSYCYCKPLTLTLFSEGIK